MPSKHVEDKAVKFLKGNAVQLAGTSRYYTVGLPGYRVDINESKGGQKSWRCDCEHGSARGDNTDVDNTCSHAVAALTFDAELMERVKEKTNG